MALDLVIDADTHLTEPPDVWTSRVPARYLDHVPRMVRDNSGRDIWVVDGDHLSTVGFTAVAGWPRPFPDAPLTLQDCPAAAYDAAARVKMMDDLGIWAQVLYPNVAGFGSQRFLRLRDDELKLVCVRAYNDFLRDWASVAPDRLITIMSIPFWDVDAAVAEVERCAPAGHRGILFTGEPQRFGLPIHFHIGSGDVASSYTPERAAAHGTAATNAYSSIEMFLKNGLHVADLITSGVLPRFPRLSFVSVESGIGWIPFVLEAADHGYLAARLNRECEWDMLPSEYFKRQVYACYWFERAAPAHLLGEIPIDRILFETDFPHPTCLYGNVREQIDASLAAASPDARRKILWENAAALYGIESPTVVTP